MTYCIKKSAAVFIFQKGNEYLFLKREHTGTGDGFYTLPAGHIDEGETVLGGAVREIKEELGVTVQHQDLEFKLVAVTQTHINFFFQVKKYMGELKNNEIEKHSDLRYLPLTAKDIHPDIPTKITLIEKGVHFWEEK